MVRCYRFSSGFTSVGGHVGLAWSVLLFVLLHLERFDAVRKLDELDAALETGLCNVRANLRQQVVVTSRRAAEPYVLESVLFTLVVASSKECVAYLARGPLIRIWLQ